MFFMKKAFMGGIGVLFSIGFASAQESGIFGSGLMMNYILPFLLVFVLIFAILQKAKILGEDKRQIDALVALAIALILIAVPQPRDIIVGIVPWLAVGVVVMLVFLVLYGFVGETSWKDNKGLKITFGILAAIFVIGVVLYVTGLWETLYAQVSGSGSGWFSTILMLAIIAGAIAVAVGTGKKGDK